MERPFEAEPSQPRAFAARHASWPEGATAGLLLIAAACLGLSAVLYHIAGPRDVFAESASPLTD
jgi:hypothetical protein